MLAFQRQITFHRGTIAIGIGEKRFLLDKSNQTQNYYIFNSLHLTVIYVLLVYRTEHSYPVWLVLINTTLFISKCDHSAEPDRTTCPKTNDAQWMDVV